MKRAMLATALVALAVPTAASAGMRDMPVHAGRVVDGYCPRPSAVRQVTITFDGRVQFLGRLTRVHEPISVYGRGRAVYLWIKPHKVEFENVGRHAVRASVTCR